MPVHTALSDPPQPQFDTSIYVARQPILDQSGDVFAYELLFRDGITSAFPEIHEDLATQSLLLSSYVDIGFDTIAGDSRVFVNFTNETLTALLPQLFPKEKLVIEILENIDPTPQLLAACVKLKEMGYIFALDDFRYEPRFEPLIDISSFVKLDFLITPRDEIESLVERFNARGIPLLAEKVETQEQYRWAEAAGFNYFQGYYFSKPEVITSTTMGSAKINLMQILAEVVNEDYDIEKIEQLVARDVSIFYKLLRYINSAMFQTAREITSIKHAVLLLGKKEFRSFISLVLAGEMASSKPLELTRLALIRAKYCEQVAATVAAEKDHSVFFLLGLFSFLPAMLDNDMASILDNLPLQPRLNEALLQESGPLADYLQLAKAVERGHWTASETLHERIGITDHQSMRRYRDAIGWADSMIAFSPR